MPLACNPVMRLQIDRSLVFALAGLAALTFCNAFAQRIPAGSYPYPYHDPYVATSSAALLTGRGQIAHGAIHDLRVTVIPERVGLPLLHDKGRLRYRLYEHDGPAPLIFLVPGIGSTAYSGSARFLAELFADHGFHVIALPSPFSWNFALAASSSGYPGLTAADARDLYRTMQLVLADVRQRIPIRIRGMGLVGLSDGALYAAFVSKLDNQEHKLGLERTLLVNPPVNLLRAVRVIDAMARRGEDLTPLQKRFLQGYAQSVVERARRQGDPFNPAYYAHWGTRMDLDDQTLRYLIGSEILESAGSAIYVADLIHPQNMLEASAGWGSRSDLLEEAKSFTLIGYVQRMLLPALREHSPRRWTLKTLNDWTSMTAVADSLRANRSVFLMHNLDDFLLSPRDIAFLKSVFGDRAILYPYGGHLGNLWFPANRRAMLSIFRPLNGPVLAARDDIE
jgi:hypothetical protein